MRMTPGRRAPEERDGTQQRHRLSGARRLDRWTTIALIVVGFSLIVTIAVAVSMQLGR